MKISTQSVLFPEFLIIFFWVSAFPFIDFNMLPEGPDPMITKSYSRCRRMFSGKLTASIFSTMFDVTLIIRSIEPTNERVFSSEILLELTGSMHTRTLPSTVETSTIHFENILCTYKIFEKICFTSTFKEFLNILRMKSQNHIS